MYLKSYLCTCFRVFGLGFFLLWISLRGKGTVGLGWVFVWFLWRNLYAPTADEGWPCPEAEASWQRVLIIPVMHAFPSHTPNNRVWWIKHHSSAWAWHPGHCCLHPLGQDYGWLLSLKGCQPLLPKNCLADSLFWLMPCQITAMAGSSIGTSPQNTEQKMVSERSGVKDTCPQGQYGVAAVSFCPSPLWASLHSSSLFSILTLLLLNHVYFNLYLDHMFIT